MSTALEIKNIEKKFGSRTVLNKVSFETKTGEVFGLLGPNGAGKTTLIKMITGLLNIDDGEILINGKSLEHDFEAAMENIGYFNKHGSQRRCLCFSIKSSYERNGINVRQSSYFVKRKYFKC